MNSDRGVARHQLVLPRLHQEAGQTTDAKSTAGAAFRLYTRLAAELSPLIGGAGVAALTARALHLAEQRCPCLAQPPGSDGPDGPFAFARQSMEQQNNETATEAAAHALATFIDLLDTMIGEGLTSRLVGEAWSRGLPDTDRQEANTQ